MILAVASGKGGTGKTTVAVGLALSLAQHRPIFLDCDVEAPNAAFFLAPELNEERPVGLMIPEVDAEVCTACGRCAEVCRYHAIAKIGQQVLVFPELCHGCGSCAMNCPTGAIHEVFHPLGTLSRGNSGPLTFAQGTLNIGQAMATPIIRELKRWMIAGAEQRIVILDAPPGNACPVVETMRGADGALLVTEPTPFGLHDLRIAVEVARGELGLPVGVVINRDGVGNAAVDDYCAAEDVPILMRIPLDRKIAEGISAGQALTEIRPEYRPRFRQLARDMARLIYANPTKVSPRAVQS